MSDATAQKEPDKKADSPAPTAPPPSASPPPIKPGSVGDVVLNEHITIFSGNRLPQYDRGPVKAYAARGTDNVPVNLFAMVCEEHLTPRGSKAPNYAAIISPSLVPLVAAKAAFWTPAGREKYCFIYNNLLGAPLLKEDLRGGLGLKPELVLSGVIRPIINVIADMRDKDIVHGNIRPSNIYDGGNKNLERAILGECLSLPPGYDQPVLYEPIERAMVSPAGRGMGTTQDDLYSFGVSLAVLMRYYDPMENMSDEEIVERKIEEGSYAAILGKDRFSGAILELLRGLLQDDETQRWNVDEVLQWLDGRRLSPKQTQRRIKASRPITFNNEKYTRPELLARDLNKNVNEARQLVENGEMEQWLSRAMEDKLATARFEKAVLQSEEGGKGAGYTERLATRVAIALHPEGPIRYKSISILPDGIGTALSEAFIMKRDLQTYIDFFMCYFITQWVDSQSTAVSDVSNLISKFDGARAYLRQKTLGGGLERCVYALNSEVHCLSEKLQKYFVRSPEEMLQAFEKISKLPNRPTMFFDRHSVAFLSVKDRKNIDPYTHDLNMPETYRRVLSELKILATIQKRSQMERFPGIAGWIIDNLGSVYERFHDRELRVEIQRKVERLKDAGDLSKIAVIFDDPALYQEDNTNFRRAMRKYYDLEQESVEIDRELQNEGTMGEETGRQMAAVVAAVLAGLIVLIMGFTSFGGSPKGF